MDDWNQEKLIYAAQTLFSKNKYVHVTQLLAGTALDRQPIPSQAWVEKWLSRNHYGLNLSQQKALKLPFQYRTAMIQDPPGTGKTHLLGTSVHQSLKGTLKKGFWNFDRFCTRAISIEPATTWGRPHHMPAGLCPASQWHTSGTRPSDRAPFASQAVVPALEVPESSVLVTGTADPLADTRTQNTIELPENAMTQPESDWDLVHGELMTFANPDFDLPPINRLEAFDPNGRCVYTRVLVAVCVCGKSMLAWTYKYENGEQGTGRVIFSQYESIWPPQAAFQSVLR